MRQPYQVFLKRQQNLAKKGLEKADAVDVLIISDGGSISVADYDVPQKLVHPHFDVVGESRVKPLNERNAIGGFWHAVIR